MANKTRIIARTTCSTATAVAAMGIVRFGAGFSLVNAGTPTLGIYGSAEDIWLSPGQ